MWPYPQKTADLVTFTAEILDRKLLFCAVDPFQIDVPFLSPPPENMGGYKKGIWNSLNKHPRFSLKL